MTQSAFPFPPGAPGSQLNADEYRTLALAQGVYVPGVLPGQLGDLAAFGDSSGLVVKVPAGIVGFVGHVYVNDTEVSVPVPANGTGAVRWDRLVVEIDYTAKLGLLKVLPGTSSDAGPTLVQNLSSKWQVHVAFVRVGIAASAIAAADVFLDRGRWARTVSDDPVGTIVDSSADVVPAGFELCYGQAPDWHYYPRLRAAWPTFEGVAVNQVPYGFNASNAQLQFPDLRGALVAGRDNMGGTPLSRLTTATWTATAKGSSGGSKTIGLAQAQVPAHTHGFSVNPAPVDSSAPTGRWQPFGAGFDISQEVVPISDGNNGDDYWLPTGDWMNQVAIATGFARQGLFMRLYHLTLNPVSVNVPATGGVTDSGSGAGAAVFVVQPTAVFDKCVRCY